MTIGIIEVDHVNVVVAKHLEDEAKHFYASLLGLKEIPKPAESQARGGAWYELGSVQLHLSARVEAGNGQGSKGHVCFTVADVVSAEQVLRTGGVEIIPSDRPIAGKPRFYVRDPGGNLIEIAQRV
jgi:catechol 2,3-dioxygenase-like lactoylglutathione lyase family enzyme